MSTLDPEQPHSLTIFLFHSQQWLAWDPLTQLDQENICDNWNQLVYDINACYIKRWCIEIWETNNRTTYQMQRECPNYWLTNSGN